MDSNDTSRPLKYWETLVNLIGANDYTKIAEIGVKQCWLTKHILKLSSSIQEYWAIDKWDDQWGSKQQFTKIGAGDWENMYLYACKLMRYYPNLHVVRMKSLDAAKLFHPLYFDLVFIDGDHSYQAVIDDIEAWLPLVRSGGILAGHDYGDGRWKKDVKRAVREKFGNDVIIADDSVWMVYI